MDDPWFNWGRYRTPDETLQSIENPHVRRYHERINALIQQYMYIDRLLTAPPPPPIQKIQPEHNEGIYRPPLVHQIANAIPSISSEESRSIQLTPFSSARDPPAAQLPLLPPLSKPKNPLASQSKFLVSATILINGAILLLQIPVVILSSSLSVFALMTYTGLTLPGSPVLVDLAKEQIAERNVHPVDRQRLAHRGVVIFAMVTTTVFSHVFLIAGGKALGGDGKTVELSVLVLAMMFGMVVVRVVGLVWMHSKGNGLVGNSTWDGLRETGLLCVALGFPLVGYTAGAWWVDPLGGVVLALHVIWDWSRRVHEYACSLPDASALEDRRSALLYLAMRFSQGIERIEDFRVSYSRDEVEVVADVVFEETLTDQGIDLVTEGLKRTLECVPDVDRAFIYRLYL